MSEEEREAADRLLQAEESAYAQDVAAEELVALRELVAEMCAEVSRAQAFLMEQAIPLPSPDGRIYRDGLILGWQMLRGVALVATTICARRGIDLERLKVLVREAQDEDIARRQPHR